jgi:hypothetical protein
MSVEGSERGLRKASITTREPSTVTSSDDVAQPMMR